MEDRTCYDVHIRVNLSLDSFSGSNDLKSGRSTTTFVWQSCEVVDVDIAVVSDWGEHLKTTCQGYAFLNAIETGLFYRALPTRSMIVKGDEAKGGRKEV